MSKPLFLAIGLVGLVTLGGCGNSADSRAKKQIAEMNRLADAIESGAEQAELETIKSQLEEASKALDALGLSGDEKKALEDKYHDEIVAARDKMMKAMTAQMGKQMEGMMKSMGSQPQGTPAMPPVSK